MRKPFTPHILPIKDLDLSKLIKLVGESNKDLSNYNGALSQLIDPSLLLATFTTKEAVLSSKIEGTQASLIDVLEKDSKEHSENIIADIEEIENYKKALEYGVSELKKKPLCLNLMKDMHSILLNGVRGYNKDRGNFRKVQNFIGVAGTTIEQASYIPPSSDELIIYLENWEKYIHLESEETLIQLAIVHAQFEIIHPFLDGNGRIGRILIPLFLYDKKYLDFPAFYMSEYLESCRSEYYAKLRNISENNDWYGWIEFFLKAIIEQSKISNYRVRKILDLFYSIKKKVFHLKASKCLTQVIDIIFENPIFNTTYVCKRVDADRSTIIRTLDELSKISILEKYVGRGQKPSSYVFTELVDIIR